MVPVAVLGAGTPSYASRRGAPYDIHVSTTQEAYTHSNTKVALLWPDVLSPMKVVYFVNKYFGMFDTVFAVSSALHIRYMATPALTWCDIVVALWKPHDPQASPLRTLVRTSPYSLASLYSRYAGRSSRSWPVSSLYGFPCVMCRLMSLALDAHLGGFLISERTLHRWSSPSSYCLIYPK